MLLSPPSSGSSLTSVTGGNDDFPGNIRACLGVYGKVRLCPPRPPASQNQPLSPSFTQLLSENRSAVCVVFLSVNMAKVNRCLKRTFTAFNVFFAVVGAAIIGLALLSQILTNGADDLPGRTTGLIILYVVGIVTMVIAILGAYGAHEENRVALIVFLVCMVIGSLLTLRAGVPFAIARPTVEGILEDNFREFLPLDAASDDVKDMANTLQTKLHCCGLFSYEDWRQNIPDSCLCDQEEQLEGQCQNVQTVGYKSSMTTGKSIYTKTCFPTLMHYTMLLADITIGVVFTLAALALLGMILSFIIIYQINYSNRLTMLLPAPTIFPSLQLHSAPPKYKELVNPPQY